MPCYSPLTGYRSKEVGKSGKRGITFDRNSAYSGVKLLLPCGQCVGCRLEHSRQWAMRCMHEKQMHQLSCFITLTYDDDWLPDYGSLVKREFQLFMKKLRKWIAKNYKGRKVRFYACGEYGDRSGRPHYHLLLFGHEFDDLVFYKVTPQGDYLYTSKSLSAIWGMGMCQIGELTFESAAYCARYVMKKVTGAKADEHYARTMPDGEVVRIEREFPLRSLRPGLGKSWFDKYGAHSYKFDAVVMNGREMRPPKYYDGKYELVDSKHVAALKVTRRGKALKHRKDNMVDRRRVREIVQLARLNQLKRDMS